MNTQEIKLTEYIIRMLDGNVCGRYGDESDVFFKRLLEENPAALRMYWELINDFVCIDEKIKSYEESDIFNEFVPCRLDEATISKLQSEIRSAPAIKHVTEQEKKHVVSSVSGKRRPVSKPAAWLAVVSAAAMIFIMLSVKMGPLFEKQPCSRITDSLDAAWAVGSAQPSEDGIFYKSKKLYKLENGSVKMVFEYGAEAVLQAPAVFRFDSQGGLFLRSGSACAYVPEMAKGFAINTPSSIVVDLGTEFGVRVNRFGDTKIQMFDGLAIISSPENSFEDCKLSKGDAKNVDKLTGSLQESEFEPTAFVRSISSDAGFAWSGGDISLADIIGGGNGFGGGHIGRGLNLTTGDVLDRLYHIGEEKASQAYVSVVGNNAVDGVFCAANSGGGVQIASNGLVTDAIKNSEFNYWGYIFYGAMHKGYDVPYHNLEKDGITYGDKQHKALTMHSNSGLTFDLDKIRQDKPGLVIDAFEAGAAISSTVSRYTDTASKCVMQVLVDGKEIFSKVVSNTDSLESIAFPIKNSDRFLTLVVTESDDGWGFDWSFWADPRLVVSRDKTSGLD
ncbi:MAG: NPCBM/NEW2 domain-containing protein [Phycisphaerae bacterium]|jgi:hypothetical protein